MKAKSKSQQKRLAAQRSTTHYLDLGGLIESPLTYDRWFYDFVNWLERRGEKFEGGARECDKNGDPLKPEDTGADTTHD